MGNAKEYGVLIATAVLIFSTGLIICSGIYVAELSEVHTLTSLMECTCTNIVESECFENVSDILSYEKARPSSEIPAIILQCFSGGCHKYNHSESEYTSNEDKGTDIKSYAENTVEFLTLLCGITDAWKLWMAIGVICITSAVVTFFLSIASLFYQDVEGLVYASGGIFLFFPGICFVLIFLTSTFSSSLMLFLPKLAKSAIATFAFCSPGGVLLSVALSAVIIICMTKLYG